MRLISKVEVLVAGMKSGTLFRFVDETINFNIILGGSLFLENIQEYYSHCS